MFTGYFDDAGGADHGFTVVAGYVSTAERWRAFEVDWTLMLDEFDRPFFDMKTLSHFKGAYSDWRNDSKRKDDFQAAACRVIADHAIAQFASFVPHDVFALVNKSYRLKEYVGNEYALAGLSCALKMRDWSRGQQLQMFFDDGTAKKGKLVDLLRKEHFAPPIFASPLPRSGIAATLPLQAADFLAYEARKVGRDDPNETRAINDHRLSLRKLLSVGSDWGEYREDTLIASCDKHPRISKR